MSKINDVVHYAPGDQISLVVDGTSTKGFKTVTMVGSARLAGGDVPSEHDDVQLDEPWPAGVSTKVIRLPITTVSGVLNETPALGIAAQS